MSSCAFAVSASASSGYSVDSALASSARMRRSTRASSGAAAVPPRDAPQRDGGGTSWSMRARQRSAVASTSTVRHDSSAGRPSARCQAATTAGSPGVRAPSSRSWSTHTSGAREAASVTRASSASSATTSRADRAESRRRTEWTTSAGCHPRSQVVARADSSARVALPEPSTAGSRVARTAAIPSASSPSGCQSPRSRSSRSQESSAVVAAMPRMLPRPADGAGEELWTAGRRPQAPVTSDGRASPARSAPPPPACPGGSPGPAGTPAPGGAGAGPRSPRPRR